MMAQEIVTWCDRHLAKGTNVPGTPRRLAADTPLLLADLCDPCLAEVAGDLRELLDEHGRKDGDRFAPPKATKRTTTDAVVDGVYPCPVPGCTTQLDRSRMRQHLMQRHDMQLSTVENQRGRTLDGAPLKHTCPDCGERFSTPQGVGAHRSYRHVGNRRTKPGGNS